MKILAFLFLILLSLFQTSFGWSQRIQWDGGVEALGIVSSEGNTPYWFSTNSETTLGNFSNASFLGEVGASYALSENASISGRLSFFYRDDVANEFQRKESYLRFTNTWLKASAGAFSTIDPSETLSVSNKNFLFSGNARPMPGVLLEANNPLKISNTFALDWGIGHYFMNDENRFVSDVWVHYKRLAVLVQLSNNHRLKAQLQYYAQWGGTSPVYGNLNDDFTAFIDVFTAREASEINVEGEITNAVGNHLGTYLVDYYWAASFGTLNIYHEHPFEDGSGTRLANFPDGIWGVGFEPESTNIFSKILYEFIDTSDQSGNTSGAGFDGYFGNNIYRTGWTYEGNVIGFPLIVTNPNLIVTDTNSPIIGNRVQAHHFGVEGTVKKWQWQVKSTYTKNLGTYRNPFPTPLKAWYNYLTVVYPTQNFGSFRFLGGLDINNLSKDVFGLGLGYRYSF